MNSYKILIGADIVPTKSNEEYFINGNITKLVDPALLDILQSADYRIFNLEVPLTDKQAPIAKCGPNLIAPTKSINGIKNLGVDFLTLANNHILDQGEQGLYSSMRVLKSAGIEYAGVGQNVNEAAKPYIFQANGKRIGIYCCAEHEFSIATDTSAGANPFDVIESFDHIGELSRQVDYVIVLYHGGKEHYRYPSPNLQKICRKIVEKGANLVICQHTHCIGCEEKWRSGTIVYGQGNFLFDHSESECWQTSLLIQLNVASRIDITYIPICKNGAGVRVAVEEYEKIVNEFAERSHDILKPGFIRDTFEHMVTSNMDGYLSSLAGAKYKSVMFRILNRITRWRLSRSLLLHTYRNKYALVLLNRIECEPHRETVTTLLRLLSKNRIT